MKRFFLILLCLAPTVFGENLTSFRLGQQLLADHKEEMAAIEFRRFALETTIPEEQVQAYIYAAYAYIQSGSFNDAENMLRHAEKLRPDNSMIPLLYAEAAARQKSGPTALYFLDLLPSQKTETNNALAVFTARRSAEMYVRSGQIEEARFKLKTSPADESASLSALDAYASGPRKSPVVGGVLGLIPGVGYWYSGETANGFRSLILNSLFMFGMYQTAQDERWAGFGIISFFEITWYTGSIYGGIDAAQRYNQNQMDRCIDGLRVPHIEPDPEITLPIFQIKVVF
ncbi:MAG TPA: hypothetical protein PLD51_02055 [Pontiellaceae bacterium]|nr:hypothetical protein [Pontiellaceae bacterium]HPR82618.1 hypothetical protein [Pontiellaceae bacterium]